LHHCRSTFPSPQPQAPECPCVTFSQISNPIYFQLTKTDIVFSSSLMHYKLYKLLLQGNRNMFCDIQIFSATTATAEALLHFSIQELTILYCSGDLLIKFALFICANKILPCISCTNIILHVCFVLQCAQQLFSWLS